MITSLMHIAVYTADIKASADFYCRVLGGEQCFTVNDDNGEPFMMYIRFAPMQYIELFRAESDAEPVKTPVGFTHLCFTVPDIFEAEKKVREAGWPIRVAPKKGNYGNWQMWMKTPEGMDMELMQTLPDFLNGNA